MPCDSLVRQGETEQDQKKRIKASIESLEKKLQSKAVTVDIGPQGAIVFKDWSQTDRNGVTDICAYRMLTARVSWGLKQAVMAAEARTGRKVNQSAVLAGLHSHDGGKTWSKH